MARALGRGIGALVNAQDPEAVGLSGLAASLYLADPDAVTAGYLSTLMRFRRADPPALLPSTLGDLGALTGASELVFDAFLTPRGLSAWPALAQAESRAENRVTSARSAGKFPTLCPKIFLPNGPWLIRS